MIHPNADLIAASFAVIASGQTPEGAYLAAPAFPTYRYSWFRDGAFIADSMDAWGHTESAAAFHAWCVATLDAQLEGVKDHDPASDLDAAMLLHTRYRPDGSPGTEEWPNFQLDGFGTWLWAFGRHVRKRGRPADATERGVVAALAGYLSDLWPAPNYDCWEEFSDRVHPATLGAMVAGLRAATEVNGDREFAGVARAVRTYLLSYGTQGGAFTKHVGSADVDASLLWLSSAYGVLPPGHAVVRATRDRIRAELWSPEGGVKRYRTDTYYGGGSWILLTAELGCDALDVGDMTTAQDALRWIEGHATGQGHLPEQVAERLNDHAMLEPWQDRWGPSACPLLWSHAAYLRLAKRLMNAS